MVVRNLKQGLLHGGSCIAAEPAAGQNGSTQQKKTRVAVLISGTGEVSTMQSAQQSAQVHCETSMWRIYFNTVQFSDETMKQSSL